MDSLFATAAPGAPSRSFLLNNTINSLTSPTTIAAGANRLATFGINGAYVVQVPITLGQDALLGINANSYTPHPVTLAAALTMGNRSWLHAGPTDYAGSGSNGIVVTGVADASYTQQGTVTQQGPVTIPGGVAYMSSSGGTELVVSGSISGAGQVVISGAPGAPRSGAWGVIPYSRVRLESAGNSYAGGTLIRNTDASFFGGLNDSNQVWAASLGAGDVTLGAPAFGGQALLTALAENITSASALMSFGSGGGAGYTSIFRMSGFSQQLGGLISLANNAGAPGCAVESATGSPTLTLTVAAGQSHIYRGRIANGIELIKGGPGTQQLIGASTYAGGTTINAGTLALGNSTALGTGPVTVNAGATLDRGGFVITNTIINNGGTVI